MRENPVRGGRRVNRADPSPSVPDSGSMSKFRPRDEYEALVYVIDLLARRHPSIDEDLIVRIVAEELERTSTAAVRSYIPELVESNARRRLRETLSRDAGAA
jgi:hypothetical protein